jgi:hypothetical protein
MTKRIRVERRKHRRIPVVQPVTVLGRDGSLIADCVLRDISVGGARLQFEAIIDIPHELCLRMPRGGKVHRHCEIVWQQRNEMGVRFVAAEAGAVDVSTVSHEVEYL